MHPHEARTRPSRHLARHGVVVEMNTLSRLRVEHEDRPLRCVSSGYMSGGCSCQLGRSRRRRRRRLGSASSNAPPHRADCFFRFAWRGEQWLAFGLADGRIRGVYCPTHRAERDARIGRLRGPSPRAAGRGGRCLSVSCPASCRRRAS